MLHCFSRDLDIKEREVLNKEMSYLLKQKDRYFRLTLILVLFGLVGGTMLALRQAQHDPGLGYLAFAVVGLYIGIFLWVYFRNVKDNINRILELQAALGAGKVRVTHCRSERMVGFPELEDEGAEYFFEVEKDKIFFIGGQEYYSNSKFPNTDFELIEIVNPAQQVVYFDIYCYGKKLFPLRMIDESFKRQLLAASYYPQDGDILPGSFDDLEHTLLKKISEGL